MEEPVSLSGSGGMDRGNMELLVMTVEIGDGRQGTIRIHEKDEPEELARAFAEQHNLESSLQTNLAMLIRQNKEMVEMRTSSPENFKWAEFSRSMSQQSVTANEPVSAEQSIRDTRTYDKHRGNVYERLYKQGMKKPQNVPAAETSKKTASQINYGEWLYIKGMKMKETQKLKAEEEKKKKEADSKEKDYTFRPTINEYSRLLSPRYFEKTEDLLWRKGDNYKERREMLKSKKEEELMKECSFVPKILSASQNVSKDSSSIHHSLYLEAEKRKQKREMISETSFKLNYGSKPNANRSRVSAMSQEEFADKLINYGKYYEDKREKAQEAKMNKELTRNGKPLFTPETGNTSVKRDGDIFTHLYAMKDDKKNKNNQEYENILQRMAEIQAASKVSENSKKMVDQRRGKQYAHIFTLLDADGDGKISADAIELEQIGEKTLQLLTPLFKAIDQGTEFDITAFVAFMEELWDKLSLDQKGLLLNRITKHSQDSLETHSINLNSAKLAEKARSHQSADMYERQVNANKLRDLRIEKEKEMKNQEILGKCTFKPSINKSKKK